MNHELLEYIIAACSLGWVVLQLFTNSKISDVNTNIEKHNTVLQAHIARDEEKHEAIDQHLSFADSRLDKLERFKR